MADPIAFADGVHDLDLSASYRLGDSGYAFSAGWRPTAIRLDGGIHWQHSALVAALARLPKLGSSSFRALFGLELSLPLFRHGGGLPTERSCWCDGVSLTEGLGFGALLRVEYASAL